VFASLRVLVALGESEVNHVDQSFLVVDAYEEVIWFHISVQEVLLVHKFKSGDHLVGKHAHCLQSQTSTTVLELILKRSAQQFEHHALIVTFNAVPVHVRNTSATS